MSHVGMEGAAGGGGRDVAKAKAAYVAGDAKGSRDAHDAQTEVAAGEAHQNVGPYIKSMVFGGLDGIITTFAVVAGVQGAGLDTDVALVLGFANLIADGLSMGLGDYLSEKAEQEYIINEMKREQWEVENYLEGEKREMVDLYQGKGMTLADATAVIDIMSKYKGIFVDTMMVEELGLMVPSPEDNPAKQGLTTCLSFFFFGTIPLISYLFSFAGLSSEEQFLMSAILSMAALMGLGVLKASLVKQNKLKGGGFMLLNGTIAASASYLISWAIEEAVSA